MNKFLLVVLSIMSFNLQAQQIDSSWVKGTSKLNDGYYKADKSTFTNLLVTDYRDSTVFYFVEPKLQIPLSRLASASIEKNYQGNPYILLTFRSTYHEKWAQLTSSQIGSDLVLMINNKMIQGSRVIAEIPNGMSAINRYDLTEDQLLELLNSIKARIK